MRRSLYWLLGIGLGLAITARPTLAQNGACCLGDASCADTNQSGCDLGSGDFLGNGTTCATTVCEGACCLEEKTCAEDSRDGCDGLGGTFQGANTTCAMHCAAKLSTHFTYQGQVKLGGVPLSGTADIEFSLWTTAKGGDQVGETILVENIVVARGFFSVPIDFGTDVFNGNARWLEVALRSPHDETNTDAFSTLSPRRLITATPYALQTHGLFVDNAGDLGVGTTAPVAKLHVNGEMAFSQGQADMRIQEVDPGDPRFLGLINLFGIGIGSNTGANRQMMMVTDGFGPNPIFTVASSLDGGENWRPRLTVTQAGNVGIGTSAPSLPLTVEGSGLSNIFTRNNSGNGVRGETENPARAGVFGLNLSTGAGVLGQSDFAGVKGESFSNFGRGVYGVASSSTGTTFGVYGQTDSPDGYAGYFEGGRNFFEGHVGIGMESPDYPLHVESSGERGVFATTSAINGAGVFGEATDINGTTYGVVGESLSTIGRGVFGYARATSGENSGVVGQSDSFAGTGVYGTASAATGETFGVRGESSSSRGHGVLGHAISSTGTTNGVWGLSQSDEGRGVFGQAIHTSGTNYGVYGESASTQGHGVYGLASASSGFPHGVLGETTSIEGIGVEGYANSVGGISCGIRGTVRSGIGYAGYFQGGRNYFGGSVGIGTDDPQSKLHILHGGILTGWSLRIQNLLRPENECGMRISDDGFFDVTNSANRTSPNFARLNSTGNWTVVSDRRLKRDIQPMSGALDKAMALEPVSFRFKNDKSESGEKDIGFIAQDVREQFPSLVTDGEMLTLNYSGLSVVAIAAIQEQHRVIERLTKESVERETEFQKLRKRLERLESLLAVGKKAPTETGNEHP